MRKWAYLALALAGLLHVVGEVVLLQHVIVILVRPALAAKDSSLTDTARESTRHRVQGRGDLTGTSAGTGLN
jgi:hypothetical protein